MNQQTVLNQIKTYLSTFREQVKISTRNSEYDINIHSEYVMIPILNIVFDANLVNLNAYDKNAVSIDLIDKDKRLIFQVTSTSTLEKVKMTLSKLMTSTYKDDFDVLYLYILTEKQKTYSQAPINKILGKKMGFDVTKHIIDVDNLYGFIKTIPDLDKIIAIKDLLEKQFSELYLTKTFTRTDMNAFKESYAEKCKVNFLRLNFFGVSAPQKPRETNLYDLFVEPTFKLDKKAQSHYYLNIGLFLDREKDQSIINKLNFSVNFIESVMFSKPKPFTETGGNFINLFTYGKHVVILGNPGAGKSSIVKYSICKILSQENKIFNDKSIYNHFPIRVELHKYNKMKVENSISFLDYLVILFSTEYQTIISKEGIEQILLHFGTIIFFDGLDEIFDVSERIDVRNDIEILIRSYQNMRSVVTSRYESYTEVKMNEKNFNLIEVNNFNQAQLQEYVQRWYSIEEKDKSIRDAETTSCLVQLSEVDNELKYNPLLLSLILILYRYELEIPTSKLEIYENCTNTIVLHRDSKEKKLGLNIKISNPIGIFSSLAFWQFKSEAIKKSFTHSEVLLQIKSLLLDKGLFDEEHEAQNAAIEFLDFAKLRSIYFENKFTHKTFLEYFTAYFLYSNYFTKPQNHGVLEKLIGDSIALSSWAVVLELLICKIDSTQIDFDIVDGLIDAQIKHHEKSATTFFLNIVRYVRNISPAMVKKLILKGMQLCMASVSLSPTEATFRRSIFTTLVTFSKSDRFSDALTYAFNQILDLDRYGTREAYIFAYEYYHVSTNSIFKNILTQRQIVIDDDYIYLLKNLDRISNKGDFLNVINGIIASGKPTSYFQQVFQSKYGHEIFFQSDKFSYCISYIFKSTPITWAGALNELLDAGITFADILRSANFESARLNQEDLQQCIYKYEVEKSKMLKISRALMKTYFQPNVTVTNDKFYHTFYIKPGSRKHKKLRY